MVRKTVAEINQYEGTTVNPMQSPEQVYELYSVPSFDTEYPEIIAGADIGSSKVTVQEGDVLICKINPRINRVWVVKHNTEHPLLASSEWIVVRNPGMDSDYLRWYFSSPTFRTLLNSEVAGIGGSLTRAQPKRVAQYTVPICPFEEQQRISASLNQVESLISLRKQQIAKLDELVKARFVEMFGDEANPRVSLIDLIVAGAGLSYGIVVPGENVADGVPMIRPSDFRNDALFLENLYRVAGDIESKFAKTRLNGTEVLVQVIGQPGQIMLTDSRCRGMNVTRNLAVVRPDSTKVDRLYLKAYMQTPSAQSFMLGETKQSTLKQLPLNRLKELPVPLPPLDLQRQFAAFVAQTDQRKLTIQHSLAQLELLKKALMQKYFG